MSHALGRHHLRAKAMIVPLTEAVVELARAGLGVGIASEWVAGPHLASGGLKVLKFQKGPLFRH